MKMTIEHARMTRRISAGAFVAASAFALSGCMGMAPTYGTGKPADTQLIEDVTGMFSLAPEKKPQIDYKPRPELVKPVDPKSAALPAPQDNIVTASAGGAWPESPEARLARIRADATAKRDELGFEPEVEMPQETRRVYRDARGNEVNPDGSPISIEGQRKEFNERLAMNNQGSPTERRFLSEPPLEYRAPAATAPTDDVGEDEWKKEKRRKAGYTKKGTGWSSWLPW